MRLLAILDRKLIWADNLTNLVSPGSTGVEAIHIYSHRLEHHVSNVAL